MVNATEHEHCCCQRCIPDPEAFMSDPDPWYIADPYFEPDTLEEEDPRAILEDKNVHWCSEDSAGDVGKEALFRQLWDAVCESTVIRDCAPGERFTDSLLMEYNNVRFWLSRGIAAVGYPQMAWKASDQGKVDELVRQWE